MELLYVIYTHNRRTVAAECFRSLFSNSDLRPDRIVIIDDGSDEKMKRAIHHSTDEAVVDFFSLRPSVGYARAAEIGFAVADMFNPKYCFFVESDYIFRKHGLDQVMEVFRSGENDSRLAGIAGYSHPDFFDPNATEIRYPRECVTQHGEDNLNREILYKPFPLQSRFGEMKLQYVSNSCGTMYLNWRLIGELRRAFYPRMEREWIDAICNKGGHPLVFRDGVMSQGLSYFWNLYAIASHWDRTRHAALADIIPSVANHLNGGGICGQAGFNEGDTSVGSPSFPKEYNV